MKRDKLGLRNIITIVICLIGLTVISSCSKENTDTPMDPIVGKWVTSDAHPIHNDTIEFTATMKVTNYFRFTHTAMYPESSYYFTYSLMGDSIIKITSHQPDASDFSEPFDYVLNGNSLIIKGFSNPFSFTNEARTDLHFTRIQ